MLLYTASLLTLFSEQKSQEFASSAARTWTLALRRRHSLASTPNMHLLIVLLLFLQKQNLSTCTCFLTQNAHNCTITRATCTLGNPEYQRRLQQHATNTPSTASDQDCPERPFLRICGEPFPTAFALNLHIVEMESLQFVGCSWFIGLIGLGFRFTRNKNTETKLCVHPCPSPVSSITHKDAPGVHSLVGYVAIPPCALSDPESR